jgi:hypothetical protein
VGHVARKNPGKKYGNIIDRARQTVRQIKAPYDTRLLLALDCTSFWPNVIIPAVTTSPDAPGTLMPPPADDA